MGGGKELALRGWGWGWGGGRYSCFLWRVVRVVLAWLYWLYLLRTSLSMLPISCCPLWVSKQPSGQASSMRLGRSEPTFCSMSINSANDLSARYLTLFHRKVLRYCSAGPVRIISNLSSAP